MSKLLKKNSLRMEIIAPENTAVLR